MMRARESAYFFLWILRAFKDLSFISASCMLSSEMSYVRKKGEYSFD